ncbi:MAG TPA: hypothetical protein VGQ38_19700 [Gaiellaceae bacterium]|jgi:hypothetical protein|nr:hypothetical protein [Gaiellaceae bacterium]
MTPLAIAILLVIVGFLSLLLGLPFLTIALFILAALAFIWALVTFMRGDRVVPTGHRTQKPELLGPGGPDDPER